jgi:hypothetical protein
LVIGDAEPGEEGHDEQKDGGGTHRWTQFNSLWNLDWAGVYIYT